MPLLNHPASLTGSLLSAGLCIGAIAWFGYIGPGEPDGPESRLQTLAITPAPARTAPALDLRRTPPQDAQLSMPALAAPPPAPAPAAASAPTPAGPAPSGPASSGPAPSDPARAPALRAPPPAAAPAPTPAAAPPAAPGGVRVQIGAVDTPEGAQAQWRRLAAKLPTQFSGKTPTGEWVGAPNASLYRSQVTGFTDKAEARAFCAAARAVGQACIVK